MSALVFQDVSKAYGLRGRLALDAVSFRVPKGSITAFVGPNGAGKTTTFGLVAGFLRPTGGHIDILGEGGFDPWIHAGRLGVLPQDAALPEAHSALEFLSHLGRLQGLGRAEARHQAALRLDQVGMSARGGDRMSSLSHGMRRRVAVASALVGEPELVLLDEPLAGVDPANARVLVDLFRSMRGRQTLMISSHNLLQLESFSDHLITLDKGRCTRDASMGEVLEESRLSVWTLSHPIPLQLLQERPASVRKWSVIGTQLTVEAAADAGADALSMDVMKWLSTHRIGLVQMRRGRTLEQTVVGEGQEASG